MYALNLGGDFNAAEYRMNKLLNGTVRLKNNKIN